MKWYQKTGYIILFLFLLWPLGVFLMWKYSTWNKVAKLIISVWFGIVLLFYILIGIGISAAPSDGLSSTTVQSSVASSVSSSLQEVPQSAESVSSEFPDSVSESVPVSSEESSAPDKSSSSESSESKAEVSNNNVEEKTLNMTLDEFVDAVNSEFIEFQLTLRAQSPTWDGKEKATTISINEHLAYTAMLIPETGQLTSIVFIGTGDGTMESGVNVMLAMAATIVTFDQSVTHDQAVLMILDMMDAEKPNEMTLNGIKYSITQSQTIGTWLTIGAV